MIGNIDWFGQIVGAVPEGDISWNAKVAKALIREGLAVVIIDPDKKKATCTLNSREKKAADIEAQNQAKEKGSPNWDKVRHDCGIKHAITEEKILTRTRVKALLSNGANLAVAPGAGSRRILIVDVDTEEEKRAFLDDWTARAANNGMTAGGVPDHTPLTVASPGVMDTSVNGEPVWVHKNGGHFWFDVPDDVELPESPGKLTWCTCHGTRQPKSGCRRAWAAYYGSGYVLVPPSVRPEGPYRLTGSVLEAPEWLTDLIRGARTDERPERADGALSVMDLPDDPIDRWSAEHSWHEILTEDGFTPHAHDNCGCPTFTRPGSPTHDKSVTGHEFGCTKYNTDNGHGPLRIWSDAMGSGTMSKLSYIAKYRYDDDMGAAMRALNIDSAHSGDDDFFTLGEVPKGSAPHDGAADAVTEDDRFAPINWSDLWAEDFEGADHLPGQLLERGQQIALIGDGKSGKSLVILDWCVKAIQGLAFLTENTTDPITVMYLDRENNRKDLFMRARSLGATPEILQRLIYLSFPPFKPLDNDAGARQVMELVVKYRPDVVIMDTVSRFIQGKENDSDTWLALYRLLHLRLKSMKVAGIRLDHFGKDAEKGGRGSSAKRDDIDHVWELMVEEKDERQKGDAIEVTTLMQLKRTHTRTGLGPDFHRIKRVGLKTEDEWLEGETSHAIADAFDGGFAELPTVTERPTAVMALVSRLLEATENGMPLRQIRQRISAKNSTIDYAVELLVEEGFISRESIGRSNVHRTVKPFEEMNE